MRLVTSLTSACALALVCAAAATAGPRMYLGFLDDASLRYLPTREVTFDAVQRADASVVRTIVRWNDVAPTRPADPTDPFDPAYIWADLDEFVVNAQQRGVEVLMTLWGTPAWANGGAGPNVPPTSMQDLTDFAHALADRYSGTHAGFPFVRFYSIWNEPNTPRFLAAADPPAAYAQIAEAAYAGLKAGSPGALVAVGETASSHAPAKFMEAVARAAPHLRFDAWAHHPYPQHPGDPPEQPERWPAVGLMELDRFGRDIDRSFHRHATPLWLTEYAESTTAVPRARQASDLARALRIAGGIGRVQMFVWLMLRDHPGDPWQSGLLGTPGYRTFRVAAARLDPRNVLQPVATRSIVHVVQVPALELKWHLVAGEKVGVVYRIEGCGRTIERSADAARIEPDGWVPLRISFRPAAGVHYSVQVALEDVHGFALWRTLELVGTGPPTRGGACALPS